MCVASFVIDTTTFSPAKFPDKYDRSAFSSVIEGIDWSKYLFQNTAGQSVGQFPITRLYGDRTVRDLDDTSLHTWQQELGLRRSEITIDGKNFDNERCQHPHNINRNQITVRKVSWDTKNGRVRPPCGRLVLRLRQRD